MKNIRAAKKLGMKTVLVVGKSRGSSTNHKPINNGPSKATEAAEATKMGDSPKMDDPAVDVSIETCSEIHGALPGCW